MGIYRTSLACLGRAVRRVSYDYYGKKKGEVTLQKEKQLKSPLSFQQEAMRETWKTKITQGTEKMVQRAHACGSTSLHSDDPRKSMNIHVGKVPSKDLISDHEGIM